MGEEPERCEETVGVIRIRPGDRVRMLVDLGNTGVTNTIDFTADGSRLLTSNSAGVQIWDLTGRARTRASSLTVPGGSANWINPNAVVEGPDLAVRVLVDDGPTDR